MKPLTKTILVTLLIVAVYFLFFSLRGDVSCSVRFEADSFQLTAPEKFSHTVNYDDITGFELVEWGEPGTVRGGDETRRYAWGQWEHDRFGACTLCLTKKIDNAILLSTSDGTQVLFNYESDQTTAAIFEMLPDLLADRAK